MQNSMMLFTFLVFDRKYTFWANFVQKINIVSLRWNLISRLIRIFRNLIQNIKTVSLRWKLIPRLIRICKIQWCSSFFFSNGNTLFGQICSKKSKLSLYVKIWWLASFEYVEFSGDIHFLIGNTLFGKIWSKKLKLSV